jgi:hypothetical protein
VEKGEGQAMEREYMADVEFQRLYDTEFQQDRTGVDSMFEEIYEASGAP